MNSRGDKINGLPIGKTIARDNLGFHCISVFPFCWRSSLANSTSLAAVTSTTEVERHWGILYNQLWQETTCIILYSQLWKSGLMNKSSSPVCVYVQKRRENTWWVSWTKGFKVAFQSRTHGTKIHVYSRMHSPLGILVSEILPILDVKESGGCLLEGTILLY